jgi:hypothetical protein
VDERKLTDLFQSAVRNVPPASFDERDVAAAARRVTVRKRSMIAGGSGFVVVAIAVGVLVGSGTLGHTLRGTSTSAASGAAAGQRSDTGQTTFGENKAPRAATGGGPQDQSPKTGTSFPTTTPMQGGGGVGGVGPAAGSTPSGCGPTDRQLAVALANELASVGAPQGRPASLGCPAGSRTAGYLVHDGTATGYVVAVVTPASAPAPGDATVGTVRAEATGSAGRGITVLSVPSAGSASAPLSGAVIGIANDLAGKF